jgi:hypothetical protein
MLLNLCDDFAVGFVELLNDLKNEKAALLL